MLAGRDPVDNCDAIWQELKEEHRVLGLTGGYTEIKVTMFRPSERFPQLKGTASEARKLARPLLAVWERHMDSGRRSDRLVRLALQASVALEIAIDTHRDCFRLIGDDEKQFRDNCFKYAACVSALGTIFHTKAVWLFHYTIKTHYLLHLGMSCGQLNPRLSWCYQGESMMSVVKQLCQSSSRGTAAHNIVRKVLTRYMWGLSFQIMGPDRWWR